MKRQESRDTLGSSEHYMYCSHSSGAVSRARYTDRVHLSSGWFSIQNVPFPWRPALEKTRGTWFLTHCRVEGEEMYSYLCQRYFCKSEHKEFRQSSINRFLFFESRILNRSKILLIIFISSSPARVGEISFVVHYSIKCVSTES